MFRINIIAFLLFVSQVFGAGVSLIDEIIPKNDAFDRMVRYKYIGTSDANDFSLFFGVEGAGANLNQDVMVPIDIGTAGQFLRVKSGANGYLWDTLDDTDMDFTDWTGVDSITTLGTITTGVWNAGAVTSSGAIAGTSLNTGQGAYELYAMNQDVETTDSPTFAGATLNGDVHFDGVTAGYDALWDKSENTFGLLDNAILGLGMGVAGSEDVRMTWDGDSLDITGLSSSGVPINIGTSAAGFDIYWNTTVGGDYIFFDYGNRKLELVDVDLRMGDDDKLYFGEGAWINLDSDGGPAGERADTLSIGTSSGRWITLEDQTIIEDKLAFTQINEYIDSEDPNHMDYGATTSHDFLIGGTEQVEIVDGAFSPTTDNDIDLGDATHEFKDMYIDGTANIDSLVADTADINAGTFDGVIGGTTPDAVTATRLSLDGATEYIDTSGGDLTFTSTASGTLSLIELSCPPMVDVSDTTVAEGYNDITSFNNKVQIKWIEITTSSTDWTFTVYEDDDAPGAHVREIVSNRSGNYNIYWDYPYEDADATSEFHYNFTDDSGANTHNIRVLGYRLR